MFRGLFLAISSLFSFQSDAVDLLLSTHDVPVVAQSMLPFVYFDSLEPLYADTTFYHQAVIVIQNFPVTYLKSKFFKLHVATRRNSSIDPYWFGMAVPDTHFGNGGVDIVSNFATVTTHMGLYSSHCGDGHECDKVISFLRFYNEKPPVEDSLSFDDIPMNMVAVTDYVYPEQRQLSITHSQHPQFESDLLDDADRNTSKYLQEAVQWANTVDVQPLLNQSLLQNRRGPDFGGVRFHLLFNRLGQLPNLRYLEVGVYNGSSLFSLLHRNKHSIAHVVAIDSWIDEHAPFTKVPMVEIKDSVLNALHVGEYDSLVSVVVGSCWEVEAGYVSQLMGGPTLVFFYDGGHSLHDHYSSLLHFLPDMADTFMLLVDDWNWVSVKSGTLAAIATLPVVVVSELVIQTESRSGHEWNNGLACFVLKKVYGNGKRSLEESVDAAL